MRNVAFDRELTKMVDIFFSFIRWNESLKPEKLMPLTNLMIYCLMFWVDASSPDQYQHWLALLMLFIVWVIGTGDSLVFNVFINQIYSLLRQVKIYLSGIKCEFQMFIVVNSRDFINNFCNLGRLCHLWRGEFELTKMLFLMI